MDRKGLFTIIGVAAFVLLGMWYAIQQRWEMVGDVVLSLIGIGFFFHFFERARQDLWSYGVFLFALILHALALYGTTPLGVRFDHYMHFIGGFTIALIVDRLFRLRLGKVELAFVTVLMALGVGAVGEIIEWLGYGILGAGEGFLFYGLGDEGEWRNATLDMIFNMFGGIVVMLIGVFRKK